MPTCKVSGPAMGLVIGAVDRAISDICGKTGWLGRVRILDSRGRSQSTPFLLMLVALGAMAEQKARYAQLVPGYWLSRDTV